jgi:hypothetical protein
MEKTNTDRDRCTGCGGCKNASHTGYAQCLLSLAARCSCAQQGTPAKEHDGTIPLSEALEALARGGDVIDPSGHRLRFTSGPEGTLSECSEDGKVLRTHALFQRRWLEPGARFRLAAPSRLKALVEPLVFSGEAETSREFAGRIAQAVTRDVCTYLREQAPSAPWHSAALLVERAYLGSK